ncbi:hypothetical protein QVD17_23712 [Tagetes erecta]|uniref:Uncharacterized protein n=1 Tax=Tagetes erecta TaxID=13708 RepID=A0AAD8KEV8_TARER|nr:hypothetical protein QVD17_23712 [Tagetes erecta]
MIPQCPYVNRTWCVHTLRMAFDPSKSPHYKVVYASGVDQHYGSSIHIKIYSSETGKWSECDARFNHKSFDNFGLGIYWNDGLHWLASAKGDLNYKLDVEDPHLRSRLITLR